jgi:hypothetical protein
MNEYLAYLGDILVEHAKIDLREVGWGGFD